MWRVLVFVALCSCSGGPRAGEDCTDVGQQNPQTCSIVCNDAKTLECLPDNGMMVGAYCTPAGVKWHWLAVDAGLPSCP